MLLKKLGAALFAGLLTVGVAYAAVGTPPMSNGGPALVDQTWLNGLAGGQNYAFQSGLSGAGTNQATATQLPANVYLLEVDVTPASTGVALPPCFQGTQIFVFNNGANTLAVYPSIANNPRTGNQDTINGGSSLSGGLASKTPETFLCASNGVWGAK